MGKYAVHWDVYASTTSKKTAAKVGAASGRPLELVEIMMTGDGQTAPADIQHECSGAYLSGATQGTGTGLTPEKFSQGQQASGATASVEFSDEPGTYASVFPLLFGFNQRGGMRWAVPQGEGFRVNAQDTNMNFGVRVMSSSAGAVAGSVHFHEP